MAKKGSKSRLLKGAVATGQIAVGAGRIAAHDITGLPSAMSGAVSIGEQLMSAWRERRESEVNQLLEEAIGQNVSGAGFAIDLLRQFSERPELEELFTRVVREWTTRVSPAVRPALALLLRSYARAGKEADVFFRGVARLLCDLEAREYESMRALFEYLDRSLPPTMTVEVRLRISWYADRDVYELRVWAAEERFQLEGFERPHLRRILRLLATNEIGYGGDIGLKGEPPVLGITRETIARIRQLMSPTG